MSEFPAAPEWGFFGRPIFRDADARNLSRVGVVDVGSNSIRLVVFDGAARSPAYFFNEKVLCGLGLGLRDTGRLNPEGRVRALSALERFAALAERMGIAPLTTVATAAVRDAEDGPEFCREVEALTGLTLHVIEGEEEARLSAQGVLLGWPEADGMICDIGGSSMELARVKDGKVGHRMTSDLGPQRLMGLKGGMKGARKHIAKQVDALFEEMGERTGQHIYLVGGSWRAIAKINMSRTGYPLHVLHEYKLGARDISATGKLIDNSDPDALRATAGISSTRMALVPMASVVLRQVIRKFKPSAISVSAYGIREGMLYEQMPQRLRDRDPLIEASHFIEDQNARLPGFGKTLYHFVRPLFANAKPAQDRILRAACLLHDVSWRSHSDYRAEVCFEYATRANLSGLSHAERVFLGTALMYRYANKPPLDRFDALLDLLNARERRDAEVLGKAMRLGAMMWLRSDAQPASLSWRPKKKELTMHLTEAAKPLFGEVVQARLDSLASTLDAKARIDG